MIIASYGWILLVVIPTLIYLSYQFFRYSKSVLFSSRIVSKLYALPLIIGLLFIGIRSSFDSSTPNQSFYSHSNSTVTNDITNNTLFALGYSVYLKAKEKMPNFGERPNNLIAIIQKLEGLKYEDNNSLRHFQKSTFSKKKNILLMLMESFGHTHVGIQGGTPTTPNLDKMSQEGLFASQMYSSSYRSNRGFEAVTSSLLPTYADTYLKLPKSINHFWTVAQTLKEQGYETIFLYGGDSKFDNMKGFALNNGFNKVIDKFDFDSSIKRYTWGVNDEELYKKAHEILNNTTQPTFLMTFSLSSHKPYDYPDGKIEYYKEAPIKSFANAIKYSDYALGKFYQQLKSEQFFEQGMLTLVGDHNAHIYGDEPIPAKEFRIPAIFIAKDLKPTAFKGVAHQVDIAPTLLDIAGVDAKIPAMGRNLLRVKHSKALIYHRRKFAYLKDDYFVLYRRNQKAEVYNYSYQKQPYDKILVDEGLAYIYGGYEIYKEERHQLNQN